MLLRTAPFVLGGVELLLPRLVDFWMDLATDERSDVEIRP